jgi:outer membrane protein OmpA-like peptidoglycan-associated protein
VNLSISLMRATAVATALTERGIPIERLQVLGRGNSELQVQTPDGVAEEENRVVEISWR